MSEQSTSIDIHAPQQVVWDVVSDIQGWPTWLPEVKKVEGPDGPPTVGSEYSFDQGLFALGFPMTGRVTQLQAPALLEMEQAQTALTTIGSYRVSDLGGGWTRVDLGLAPTGTVTKAVGTVFGSSCTAMLRDSAERLKTLCEERA